MKTEILSHDPKLISLIPFIRNRHLDTNDPCTINYIKPGIQIEHEGFCHGKVYDCCLWIWRWWCQKNTKFGALVRKITKTHGPVIYFNKLTLQGPSFHARIGKKNQPMDVSENSGTPKSSILIGFSIINHPFWGTLIFGNTPINLKKKLNSKIERQVASLSPKIVVTVTWATYATNHEFETNSLNHAVFESLNWLAQTICIWYIYMHIYTPTFTTH